MPVRRLFFLPLILLCAAAAGAQTIRPSSLPVDLLRRLRDPALSARLAEQYAGGILPAGDLVVGYPNPDETREIDSAMTIAGNIVVVNNGRLRFNNADVRLQGNVLLMQNGALEFSGGSLTVLQYSLYQSSFLALNRSSLAFRNLAAHFSGFNANCGLTDSASLTMENAEFPEGFLTVAVSRSARVSAGGGRQTGEYLFFDHARGDFRNCDGLLTWFTAPAGSDIDLTLPAALPGSYIFPDSARAAAGVDYRISYDNVSNARWALMTYAGAKVRVSDADLLACGSFFDGAGQVDVAGLANNQTFTSFRFPAADRDLLFTNTTVRVWNLYPAGATILTLRKSIFGELIGLGRSATTITDSYCDGTGGYLGATDTARVTAVNTQIAPEVNARSRSFILLYYCSLPSAPLHASDNGVLALLNTSFSALPVVTSGSAAVIGSIDEPSSGFAGQRLRIYGTARIVAGRDLPVFLNTHWLEFSPAADPANATRITTPSVLAVYRDMLGTWDTRGLSPGRYNLRLNLQLSTGGGMFDTIAVDRTVSLLEAPLGVGEESLPRGLFLSRNYPNPFGVSTSVTFAIPARSFVSLRLCDPLGRIVKTIAEEEMEAGAREARIDAEGLKAGVYFLLLESNGARAVRAVEVVR